MCFDLDNTLVHSNRVHVEAFKMAFLKNKLPVPSDAQILAVFSLPAEDMVKRLSPRISAAKRRAVVKDHNEFVVHDTIHCEGVQEALRVLKTRYRLALVSNLSYEEILATLRTANIDKGFFEVIIGNDMVKNGKPAPDEIFKAEQLLNIHEGYMVGDSIYDIRAGKKAGLKTVGVLTGNHTMQELENEGADYIVSSVALLPKIL